jgi:hypothetical protein
MRQNTQCRRLTGVQKNPSLQLFINLHLTTYIVITAPGRKHVTKRNQRKQKKNPR